MKAKKEKPLKDEIVAFIRARYYALGVNTRHRTPLAQSVLKLNHESKLYDHYQSEVFWAKWVMKNISDFRNIIPCPESRFRHQRITAIKLINKCESLSQ